MYLAEDLFCLKTFTIVVLKREGASVVISARGIVIVEVVMQTLIHLFFRYQIYKQKISCIFIKLFIYLFCNLHYISHVHMIYVVIIDLIFIVLPYYNHK